MESQLRVRRFALSPCGQTNAEFLCPECERVYNPEYQRCPYDGAKLVNIGAGLAAGTVIDNRYTIRRLLGKGGMGSVYVARQHSMDRDVAVKIMHHRADGNHASVRRFFWEVRAARRLQSPHTITVFDFGQTDRGSLYLVMELLKGTTVGHLLGVEERIRPHLALRIALQVCRSLEEAHSKQIIHRDLKSDNIFLVHRAGQRDFVKVLDFGIAKFLDPDDKNQLTQTGTVFGTPRYMSPEQANSEEVDARSDLYSLGILLYEMLSGQVPFDEDNALELLYKQVHTRPTPLCQAAPWIAMAPELGSIVDRLLEKRREDRLQSAAEVRAALQRLLAEMPADPPVEPPALVIEQVPPAVPAAPSASICDTQQPPSLNEVAGRLREAMPTPAMGTQVAGKARGGSSRPPPVGRDSESGRARRALEDALARSKGCVLVLAGEAGAGKAHMTEWLRGLAGTDFAATTARGYSGGAVADAMPVIRSAFEHLLGVTILERTALRQHIEDHPAFSDHVEHDLLDALTIFLRPPLTASGGDEPKTSETVSEPALFASLHRLLVRLGNLEPVFLDVGSLNTADPATIRFLGFMSSAFVQTPARVCIAGTLETLAGRRDEVASTALAPLDWRPEADLQAVEVISLGRLEGGLLAEFLRSLGSVYPSLAGYLGYLSGGNPRALTALVSRLEADPERLHFARTWSPVGRRTPLSELPRELVDRAGTRIDEALIRLGNPTIGRAILRRAALLGAVFEVDLLEGCLSRENREELLDGVEEVLNQLIDCGCLHELDDGECLGFDTGLMREVVLGRVRSQRTTRKLHALIAMELAARPPGSVAAQSLALANHLELSGDSGAALEHRLAHARRRRAEGSPDEALQAFLLALDNARALGAEGEDAAAAAAAERESLFELARIHFEIGLYEQSGESYEQLIALGHDLGDKMRLAEAQQGLGEVQDALAEYGSAAATFQQAGEGYLSLGDEVSAAWCDLKRARSLEQRGNLAEADRGYKKARQVFARTKDEHGLAACCSALGVLALAKGDPCEASRQLRRSVDLFRRVGAGIELGKALFNLSLAATERRDLLVALDAANKALEIFDREDFRTGVSQCLGTIARVLVTQRRPAEARSYFERALRLRQDLGDRRGVAEAVSSLADIALALERPDQALELALRAREIFASCGEFRGAAMALRTMGLAQRATRHYEDALACLREAVATYESLAAKDGDLCAILQSLAECEAAVGLEAESADTLRRALLLARELGLSYDVGHLEARLRAHA